MELVSLSDIGQVRSVNEDRCMTQGNINGLSIAIVADGMGGHNAGDIASQLAIDLVFEQLQSISVEMPIQTCMQLLHQAISQANQRIYELSNSNLEYRGMGTTLVVAVVYEKQFIIAHIGDSRAYLFQESRITQLTVDHSLVSELIKSGQISPDEAEHHPRKHILTRALGTEIQIEVDMHRFDWMPGDVILLCTDGLSGLIDADQILHIVDSSQHLEEASHTLIHQALDAGGYDNITLALIAHHKSIRKGQ